MPTWYRSELILSLATAHMYANPRNKGLVAQRQLQATTTKIITTTTLFTMLPAHVCMYDLVCRFIVVFSQKLFVSILVGFVSTEPT